MKGILWEIILVYPIVQSQCRFAHNQSAKKDGEESIGLLNTSLCLWLLTQLSKAAGETI